MGGRSFVPGMPPPPTSTAPLGPERPGPTAPWSMLRTATMRFSFVPSPGRAGPQNRRSAASLGPDGPVIVCDASPTAASTAQKVQSLQQRPAHAPPQAVYLLRIDGLKYPELSSILYAHGCDRPRRPATRHRSGRTTTGRKPMHATPRHPPDAAPPSDRQPATRRRCTSARSTLVRFGIHLSRGAWVMYVTTVEVCRT